MFADFKNGSMMKLTTKISVTAASLAVLVSMGGIAATAGAHENDASAVTQANVSLFEAFIDRANQDQEQGGGECGCCWSKMTG